MGFGVSMLYSKVQHKEETLSVPPKHLKETSD